MRASQAVRAEAPKAQAATSGLRELDVDRTKVLERSKDSERLSRLEAQVMAIHQHLGQRLEWTSTK